MTATARPATEDLASFEGLVYRTAQMYAPQLNMDPEDLRQELRIKVVHALARYNKTRSDLPIENYVFGALVNRVKDMKRNAARAAARRDGAIVLRIEDMMIGRFDEDTRSRQEVFDSKFNRVERDVVYAEIEERYQLPPGVTESERRVLCLLAIGCNATEIASLLHWRRAFVDIAIEALREKLAHLKPRTRSTGTSPDVQPLAG